MLPIQSFSTAILTDIIRRQPESKERTRFAWEMAVGHALARATTVELIGGVLTVRCVDRRWAPELTRARDVVLRRLQELLGQEAVVRLTISSTTD